MDSKYIFLLFIGFIFNLSIASTTPDWGKTGHRAIGDIADKHLSKKAKKNINKLLQGHGLAYVSNFGDEIKSDKKYKKFSAWHYVNYPFDETYSNSEKSPSGDVVTGINKCIEILKNKNTSQADQVFYLKMLVHLVGDLHQPLHVGLADDKGGNDFQVRWFNKGTNLHRVWDSDMINSYQMSYSEIADNFVDYPKDLIKLKQQGSVASWADEIHKLAEKVYASATIGEKLSYRYSYDHLDTAKNQLYLAGIRLAQILNDIYG